MSQFCVWGGAGVRKSDVFAGPVCGSQFFIIGSHENSVWGGGRGGFKPLNNDFKKNNK